MTEIILSLPLAVATVAVFLRSAKLKAAMIESMRINLDPEILLSIVVIST